MTRENTEMNSGRLLNAKSNAENSLGWKTIRDRPLPQGWSLR
jgi:hypothetical protein